MYVVLQDLYFRNKISRFCDAFNPFLFCLRFVFYCDDVKLICPAKGLYYTLHRKVYVCKAPTSALLK